MASRWALDTTRPMQAAAPLAGVAFLALPLMGWRFGVHGVVMGRP